MWASGTHDTTSTTSLAPAEARSVSTSRHMMWRQLGSHKEVPQVFASGIGNHWGVGIHSLVSGVLGKHSPMFVENFGYMGKSWVIWDRKDDTVSIEFLDLKESLGPCYRFDPQERCTYDIRSITPLE